MMLSKRTKIPCYILVYDQVDIIDKTLGFLSKYIDHLSLIIIENPSKNSVAIKNVVEKYRKKSLVDRHYIMNDNISGEAFGVVFEQEPVILKKSKYVIMTDGDMVSNDMTWLEEQLQILKNREVFVAGISLDMSNLPIKSFPEATSWIPEDISVQKDYIEATTGCHLLLFRSKQLVRFVKYKDKNGLSFVDGTLHKYCYDVLHKKWARTKQAKALHLTWDLYANRNHPYTKAKLKKSFEEIWYHNKKSGFKKYF